MSFDGFVYVVSQNLFEIAFVFLFSFFLNTGMEESNEVRPLVPVTEEEPNGLPWKDVLQEMATKTFLLLGAINR